MYLKILCDTSTLCLCDHVKGKLFKDSAISDSVRFRQSLPIDGRVAETQEKRLLAMSYRYICKFSEASATQQLPTCDSNESATSLWSCRRIWRLYA
jgi:hypothetical protein